MKADTKICGRCKKHLLLSEYYKQSNTKDGKSNYCKKCKGEYQKERTKILMKKNPAMYLLKKSCSAAVERSKPSYMRPGYENVLCSFDSAKSLVKALWDYEVFKKEWITQTNIYVKSKNYKDRPTLDRIDPDQGYEISNIRVLPQYINVSRGYSERKIS